MHFNMVFIFLVRNVPYICSTFPSFLTKKSSEKNLSLLFLLYFSLKNASNSDSPNTRTPWLRSIAAATPSPAVSAPEKLPS